VGEIKNMQELHAKPPQRLEDSREETERTREEEERLEEANQKLTEGKRIGRRYRKTRIGRLVRRHMAKTTEPRGENNQRSGRE
jgi:plasmid stabilization system protein ParE